MFCVVERCEETGEERLYFCAFWVCADGFDFGKGDFSLRYVSIGTTD